MKIPTIIETACMYSILLIGVGGSIIITEEAKKGILKIVEEAREQSF